MFTKETYIRRRAELKKLVGEGVIVLFGNNDAPCNYPANCYAPMRQDSSFLYYFGQHRDENQSADHLRRADVNRREHDFIHLFP